MTVHENLLVIFTRVPLAGRTKTRLTPVYTPEEAAEIHGALLGDVVERSLRALAGKAEVRLAWSEQPPQAVSREIDPGLRQEIQPPGSLGERMALTIQRALQAGHRRVAILGSDAPTLPGDHLVVAFEALGRRDVVLGPASDGGYYLIGMSRLHPEIFQNMSWGTGEVLKVTRRRLRQAGVGWEELGAWRDVDTPADVSRLWKELLRMRKSHPAEVPPRTWEVLARLAPGRAAE